MPQVDCNGNMNQSPIHHEEKAIVRAASKSSTSTTTHQSSEELISTPSERALLRRVDLRVVPILLLIYLLNFLDRTNIANAMTLGLQSELRLVGDEINTTLAVFYIPYILCEVPSNALLTRCKPHVWLTTCLFMCGIIIMCHGFIRHYRDLITVRVLLGVAESGVLPGCCYLLRMWYKQEEIISRFVVFFTAATLSGAFGSLLASAIQQMDGVANVTGWRWIFIIEGVATVAFAPIAFFATPDFPEDARWLSENERQTIMKRRKESQPETQVTIKQGLKNVFTSLRSYFGALAALGCMLPAYSTSYFLPTIISQFHYSKTQTQLHAVAPFAVGLIWSVGIAFISVRINQRLVLILLTNVVALIAAGLLFHLRSVRAMYAATFLFSMGVWGAVPLVLCWNFMNLRGHAETSVGSAFYIASGNFGGIIATYAFVKDDAPYYHKGYALCVFGICLTAGGGIAYALCCRFANRSRPVGTKLVDR